MANMTVENVDLGSAIYESGEFENAALTFTGADVYVDGTILARSSEKLIAYIKGTNDPVAVLTYDVEALAAGDIQVRAMISGSVRTERLVIDADGDASNVDASVRDALRAVGLVSVSVTELSKLDNQ